MKKTISYIMALCLLLSGTAIGSSATEVNGNTFYYGDNKEIVIESEDISQEKMQFIADFIAGDNEVTTENEIATCGILCIFGHNLATSSATETSHNAYSSSPKCLVNTYSVEYCTRSSCDYISKELVKSYRTSACHG